MHAQQNVVAGPRMVIRDRPGQQDEPAQSRRRRRAVLAVLAAAQFLTVLDLWVVNIALPTLQHEFAPASLSDVSWILDVYAIVLAALLLPAGRAADTIGRRTCFLAGLVVFGVASLGCAVAPELAVLIAFRALQAGGAALLMPTSLGLALSVFPAHQRGTAVGVWAGVGALAAGSGPVLGGLLVESSWRWIFLINVLGDRPAGDLAGFHRAWIVVLITATMTAAAGLAAGRGASSISKLTAARIAPAAQTEPANAQHAGEDEADPNACSSSPEERLAC
jgi:MFS family permease